MADRSRSRCVAPLRCSGLRLALTLALLLPLGCHEQPVPEAPLRSTLPPTVLATNQPNAPAHVFESTPRPAVAEPMLASQAAAASTAGATGPVGWKNLQILPATTSKQELVATMRGFGRALGVRCQFCHAADDFSADPPRKQTARQMMRMVAELNRTNFAGERVLVCGTCHEGRPIPETGPPMLSLFGTPIAALASAP